MFSSPNEDRVLLNIGGIANITVLTSQGGVEDLIAFDTGPGNIDAAAVHLTGGKLPCDLDGRMALQGTANGELVARWLQHPFLRRSWPKTTGREEFGSHYTKS